MVLGYRYTHLKALDHVVSGARFLTGSDFECDNAHLRFVAVIYMLYMVRCDAMDTLYGALHVPYVPFRVTRGALVAHAIYLCASSLQNLEVPQYFYSHLSVSVERSF